jgi:hypothetical protein
MGFGYEQSIISSKSSRISSKNQVIEFFWGVKYSLKNKSLYIIINLVLPKKSFKKII